MVTSTSAQLASWSPIVCRSSAPAALVTFGQLELANGYLKAAVNALNLGSAARNLHRQHALVSSSHRSIFWRKSTNAGCVQRSGGKSFPCLVR
jgi:hypothetical protein